MSSSLESIETIVGSATGFGNVIGDVTIVKILPYIASLPPLSITDSCGKIWTGPPFLYWQKNLSPNVPMHTLAYTMDIGNEILSANAYGPFDPSANFPSAVEALPPRSGLTVYYILHSRLNDISPSAISSSPPSTASVLSSFWFLFQRESAPKHSLSTFRLFKAFFKAFNCF
ncbi:hypothetical protein MMC07_000675 [Pseudocyphellaria aurata]|nr:hypothetical protein [Pseudocyphellaria aurata]